MCTTITHALVPVYTHTHTHTHTQTHTHTHTHTHYTQIHTTHTHYTHIPTHTLNYLSLHTISTLHVYTLIPIHTVFTLYTHPYTVLTLYTIHSSLHLHSTHTIHSYLSGLPWPCFTNNRITWLFFNILNPADHFGNPCPVDLPIVTWHLMKQDKTIAIVLLYRQYWHTCNGTIIQYWHTLY